MVVAVPSGCKGMNIHHRLRYFDRVRKLDCVRRLAKAAGVYVIEQFAAVDRVFPRACGGFKTFTQHGVFGRLRYGHHYLSAFVKVERACQVEHAVCICRRDFLDHGICQYSG